VGAIACRTLREIISASCSRRGIGPVGSPTISPQTLLQPRWARGKARPLNTVKFVRTENVFILGTRRSGGEITSADQTSRSRLQRSKSDSTTIKTRQQMSPF
jgi:hypothetical protein